MPRLIQFEGRTVSVPDDATDAEVSQILTASAPPAAPGAGQALLDQLEGRAPTAHPAREYYKPPTMTDRLLGALGYANQTGAVMAREATRSAAGVLGTPVDIVNIAPQLLNLLPGVSGVGPITEQPFFGSERLDAVGNSIPQLLAAAKTAVGFPTTADPKPQDAFQRMAGRISGEIGSSMLLPLFALRGVSMGSQAARAMAQAPAATAAPSVIPGAQWVAQQGNNVANLPKAIMGNLYEAAAVNPVGMLKRESLLAGAAGAGAGVANEAAGNPQHGNNFWSDFGGSMAGVLGGSGLASAGGALKNLFSSVTGRAATGDAVREAVTDRLINNSTMMGERVAQGGNLDTTPLVQALQRKAPIEEAVPGYRAGIADRTQDPGLTTFQFNTDARIPGQASARRSNNETAVSERMQGLAPQGDPATFRSALEADRTTKIANANQGVETARQNFDTASQAVVPQLPLAEQRGAVLRDALQNASDNVKKTLDTLWAPINQSQAKVDINPLTKRFSEIDNSLSMNESRRFRPSEADIPNALTQPQPSGSGLVDQYGAPLAPQKITTAVEMNEITGIRSGLTDDIRRLETAGQTNEARVLKQYRDSLDKFVEGSVPPELKTQYEQARAATKDYHDRFSRPGDAVAETLRPKEGGGYRQPDSNVSRQFVPTDQGNLKDYRALLAETKGDPKVRGALEDEILSDVKTRGLIDKPEQLTKYLGERKVVLNDFPDLRQKLEAAGAAKSTLAKVEADAKTLTTELTTPGRSPNADYLKYGNERTADSMRTVITADKPGEAAKALIAAAGDTPAARLNARTALWEEVKRVGRESAPGATGTERWNGKRLASMFRDPKVDAVAKELWSDAPQELADVKKVFSALEGAEGSSRARIAGSSGTAQSLSGKFDPAMSASSLASRMRSVHRGQLSPSIAAIDIGATWLRRRSLQAQSHAIEQLTAEVVNNPGLAAELLKKYNPADWPAKRRLIQQAYGVRATQTLNLLDEAHAEDPVKDAVMKK